MSQSIPSNRLPQPERLLTRLPLADLPTPVREDAVQASGRKRPLWIKRDDLSSGLYGGNKVRKLEYYLERARARGCRRIATFGTVGSHHALATALFADKLGWPCTCFLSHQKNVPGVAEALALHLAIGTRIVRYGGRYADRVRTLREHLWGEQAYVVPAGGTCWLGTYAFVCAGVELARQVAQGMLPEPDRLYVATGTMGTAAGLALGLALAGARTEVQAVRVSHLWLCNERELARVMRNTTGMMRRLDPAIPADLHARARIVLRHEFFAGGYAHSDRATDEAITVAAAELGLALEQTYTGKAMAALLRDLAADGKRFLFWNTASPVQPPMLRARLDPGSLPEEFRPYLVPGDGDAPSSAG